VVIQPLEERGLPVILLAWRAPQDIRQVIRLLGEVFGEPEQAEAYIAYFDETVERVGQRLADLPAEGRVTVLYIDPQTMANTHLITEWWIEAAGSVSVTKPIHVAESVSVTLEQVLAWDPDVIVVRTKADAESLRRDPRFATLRATRTGRIHVTPTGAHLWAHRTSEQPLTVLWAAKTFYPDRFADLDLAEEARSFYSRFYGVELTAEQVAEILASGM
jgi:iron complex transport system substrate-binding protein